MKTHSRRLFQVIEVHGKRVDKHSSMSLDYILQDLNSELNYALQDIIDEVLDLKEGESLYFFPNRDDKLSKGIIVRLN